MVNGPYEQMHKLAVSQKKITHGTVLNTEKIKAQGLARPSYASARLQEMDPNGDLKRQERTIKNTSSQVNVGKSTRRLLKTRLLISIGPGGADTVISSQQLLLSDFRNLTNN